MGAHSHTQTYVINAIFKRFSSRRGEQFVSMGVGGPHRTPAAPAPPRSGPFCWGGSSSASEHSSGRDAGAGRRGPCERLKLRQAVPQYQRETSPSFFVLHNHLRGGGWARWHTPVEHGQQRHEDHCEFKASLGTQRVQGSHDYSDCIVKDTDLHLLSFHRTVSLHIKYPACDIVC